MNSNPNPSNMHNTNGDRIGDGRPSWSLDSNWTIIDGSLQASITVESSDSVIDSDGNDIDAVDSVIRSHPLILKPPSPDSDPCEMKISFTQRYEIRQVYVRSTARVYEIYYAPSFQSSNEYLCTVRCSTAERGGETLQVTNVARGIIGGSAEGKYTGEANSSSSEDDWVEVKVPESSVNENGVSYLPKTTKIKGENSIQDLYEATAEISDADECTSITIRLLSLQNKLSVYVEEVYVFADPVDPGDLENQPVQIGSSTGGALMAMLVPTLLQFKSNAGQMRERLASSNKLKGDVEIESKSVDLANTADSTHQDEKLSVDQQYVNLDGTRAETAKFHLPSHDPISNRCGNHSVKNNFPLTRIEGLLEQLDSRVSRVEECCSRFEENMLKPINSMDARLQLVERQLEVLSGDRKYPELPACTRICAPSFSCGESNSSSMYDDSSRHTPLTGISVPERRDLPSADMPKLYNNLLSSECAPHFLPSLVIAAPEFSCGEDDEDNEISRSSESTSVEKSKRPLSIDDALAAALSGFLSTSINSHSEDTNVLKVSASGYTSKSTNKTESSTQTIAQTAHEFTIKENDNEEPLQSTEMPTDTAPEFTLEGGDELHLDYRQSPATALHFTSKEDGDIDTIGSQCDEIGKYEMSSDACAVSGSPLADVTSVDSVKRSMMDGSVDIDEQCQSCEGVAINGFGGNGDACLDGLARGFGDTDNYQINEEFEPTERCNDMPSLQKIGVRMLSGSQVEDRYDTPESAAENSECEVCDKSSLQNLTESSSTSAVDLEFPILDVKFASHECSTTESPFDALLHDVAGIGIQTSFAQEVDDVIIGERAVCTSTVDDKLVVPSTDNILLLDLGTNADDMSSNMGKGLHNPDDKLVDLLTDNVLLLEMDTNAEEVSPNLGNGLHDPSTSSNHPILASLI